MIKITHLENYRIKVAKLAHEITGQYLKEGKAPSVELQSAFNKFKQWLMAIYEVLKGKGQLPRRG